MTSFGSVEQLAIGNASLRQAVKALKGDTVFTALVFEVNSKDGIVSVGN